MDIVDFKKLKELKNMGVLSQEEFDKKLSEYILSTKKKSNKNFFSITYKFFIVFCIVLSVVSVSVYFSKKYFNISSDGIFSNINYFLPENKSHFPTRQIKTVSGLLQKDVEASLTSANMPTKFIKIYKSLFSNQIDKAIFNDRTSFAIKWIITKSAKEEIIDIGDMIYATFEDGDKIYKRYLYNGKYYNEKGENAINEGLIKKPLASKNSSVYIPFGYVDESQNDVSVYTPAGFEYTPGFHKGIDYSADEGTAVYASGDGTIEKLRYEKIAGNNTTCQVVIRHNSEYKTAYGCLKKYVSDLKVGTKVKKGQIIGYVGRCMDWFVDVLLGSAKTANAAKKRPAYLHFELIHLDKHLNPLKAKIMDDGSLSGNDLINYREIIKNIDANIIPEIKTTTSDYKSKK